MYFWSLTSHTAGGGGARDQWQSNIAEKSPMRAADGNSFRGFVSYQWQQLLVVNPHLRGRGTI